MKSSFPRLPRAALRSQRTPMRASGSLRSRRFTTDPSIDHHGARPKQILQPTLSNFLTTVGPHGYFQRQVQTAEAQLRSWQRAHESAEAAQLPDLRCVARGSNHQNASKCLDLTQETQPMFAQFTKHDPEKHTIYGNQM